MITQRKMGFLTVEELRSQNQSNSRNFTNTSYLLKISKSDTFGYAESYIAFTMI